MCQGNLTLNCAVLNPFFFFYLPSRLRLYLIILVSFLPQRNLFETFGALKVVNLLLLRFQLFLKLAFIFLNLLNLFSKYIIDVHVSDGIFTKISEGPCTDVGGLELLQTLPGDLPLDISVLFHFPLPLTFFRFSL